jgi:pantothenate synthetase
MTSTDSVNEHAPDVGLAYSSINNLCHRDQLVSAQLTVAELRQISYALETDLEQAKEVAAAAAIEVSAAKAELDEVTQRCAMANGWMDRAADRVKRASALQDQWSRFIDSVETNRGTS